MRRIRQLSTVLSEYQDQSKKGITLMFAKRILLTLIITVITVTIGGAQMTGTTKAMADLKCKPVTGHIHGQLFTGPECTSPSGFCFREQFFGSIQGNGVSTLTSIVPS